MNAFKASLLIAVLACLAVPIACSSEHPNDDAGSGGRADSGAAGARSAGGATGTGGATGAGGATSSGAGGRGGTGAGGRVDAGATSGMGGIVIVDAAGNTFTCADLQACCNSITIPAGKTACLNQYTMLLPMGNTACGNLLAQIKANGVCR